ncbi:MAG: hypothetical protein ACI4QE_01530 [Acutalibacteraceae bacterium]
MKRISTGGDYHSSTMEYAFIFDSEKKNPENKDPKNPTDTSGFIT